MDVFRYIPLLFGYRSLLLGNLNLRFSYLFLRPGNGQLLFCKLKTGERTIQLEIACDMLMCFVFIAVK